MSRQKKAAFLADCLARMPKQRPEVKAVVDTVILGLKRIANGGQWRIEDASEESATARAAFVAAAYWGASAAYAAARAATLAVYSASMAAADSADYAEWAEWVDRAAEYAARAHPDPAKELARQAKVRQELGL
jgi:hypothetical protein